MHVPIGNVFHNGAIKQEYSGERVQPDAGPRAGHHLGEDHVREHAREPRDDTVSLTRFLKLLVQSISTLPYLFSFNL